MASRGSEGLKEGAAECGDAFGKDGVIDGAWIGKVSEN